MKSDAVTFNLPISKIDEEKRMVYGIATTEALDKQGEIVDYEASKKAFSSWVGNIREMHDEKKAVGKAVEVEFDDANKQVMIGAYISKSPDGEAAWTKVKENILTGFSIGGKVFKIEEEKVKNDGGAETTARRISDYELSETSLVDNPANPEAKFVMVKHADGKTKELDRVEEMVEQPHASQPAWMKMYTFTIDQHNQKLQKVHNEDEAMEKKDYSDKERKQMAESGEALPDGSFPIKTKQDLKNAIRAIGRAKDEAKAKAHIKARAKDLGAEDLIPDTWKVDKADMEKVNVAGGEERDNEGNVVAEPKENENAIKVEPKEEKVEKVNVVGGEERDENAEPVGGQDVVESSDGDASPEDASSSDAPEADKSAPASGAQDEPSDEAKDKSKAKGSDAPKKDVEEKADKAEMKKGLYEVAGLADCIAMLACIRDYVTLEAEIEEDGSAIPARLTEAIDNLGGVLTDMAAEEAKEAGSGDQEEVVEASAQPDMTKVTAAIEEATARALNDASKAFGDKVEALVKPLADRVANLEHQPSTAQRPVASFVEVDKAAGAPLAPSDAEKADAEERLAELKKIASDRKDDRSFSRRQRAELVDEMWRLSKVINGTTTRDLNPGLVAQYPAAFSKA